MGRRRRRNGGPDSKRFRNSRGENDLRNVKVPGTESPDGENCHQLVVACVLASVCSGVVHTAAGIALLLYARYTMGDILRVRLVAYQVVPIFLMFTFISLCFSLPFALAIRKAWLLYRSRAGRRKLRH